MKKCIFLSIFFLFYSILFAQTNIEQKYLLTTQTNTFGLTTIGLLDPYLSPMTYTGAGVEYNYDGRRYFSAQNTKLSMDSKMNMICGLALNPAATASMTYMGMTYGWGMHYHFRIQEDFRILAGGLWDVDFGFKDISRNVNNPVNIDLATNLNLSMLAIYDIPFWRRVMQLQLAVQSPVLGCMFVPQGGASYYEMFELGNLKNTSHFSSLYNKQGLKWTLSLDFPFNHSVLRLGLSSNELKYSANDMVFNRNEYSFLIGTTFDVATFAGRKNKAPKNFLSTNE